ncbi:helix-turn-helix domain-containing protein [Arthrobacter agilis]|uniref:helix-turn-helix domain-containing protein n=1 Tax=Arthrobacter agilis TaxID=37921 RepID=UPI0027D7B029|nr:AraC family transcriptional regulator [Arthrobacter agilis]
MTFVPASGGRWVCPGVDGLSLSPVHGDDPDVTVRAKAVGGMVAATTTQTALRVTAASVGLRGMTYVGFAARGRARVAPAGSAGVPLQQGEALILTEPIDLVLESSVPTRWIHLLVPSARLRQRGVDLRVGECLIRRGALAGPVAAFASALIDAQDGRNAVSTVVAARVLENLLVAVYGDGLGDADPRADQRWRLRRAAIDLIDESFSDPLLTPAAVAEVAGVSLRHLQRAFEGSGTSIAAEISQRRTDNACMLLSAPASRELTVNEIARRSGFSSAFELRSRVRSRFGVPPSELRRTLGVGADVSRRGQDLRRGEHPVGGRGHAEAVVESST